jgi:DNA polymerase I-like protein with 3'-5' exonuclease and polymerase domains
MLQADREGMVYSAILRRRREFPIKQFDLSEVVNYPVQATGADIINLGLVDIMPRLPKNAFPILQIHDALVFEGDEDDADLLKKLVVTSFTREVTYEGRTVHFPVDAKAGKSWAEVN